jgi:hypothetical protein
MNPESRTNYFQIPGSRSRAPRYDGPELLPVIGQNLRAGPAEPGAILLQARQNDHIAVIEMGAAKSRRIARTGVALLRRRGRCQQNERNNEKKSGHDAYALPVMIPARSNALKPARQRILCKVAAMRRERDGKGRPLSAPIGRARQPFRQRLKRMALIVMSITLAR